MPDLLKARSLKARKPHRCSCCGATYVQPGQTYTRTTYAYDGQVYDWLICPDCDALAGDVDAWDWTHDSDDGIGSDDYVLWAEEHVVDPRAVDYLRRCGWTEEQIAELQPDGAS